MATGTAKSKWHKSIIEAVQGSDDIAITYTGKKLAADILLTAPTPTHAVWPEIADQPNRLYLGNNQGILADLLQNNAIVGHVQLIYIDPPFATNSAFQSRSQEDAYLDILTGSTYLEFLRERLVLLRELLASDGSIYVHLDQKMVFPVKVLLDELFGRNRFRSMITRRKCHPKNYTKKTYGNISDYVLFYTKSDKYIWNRPVEQWTEGKIKKEYTYTEPETGRKYKKVPLHAPGTRNGLTGQAWKGMLPPSGKHWQFIPATLDQLDHNGEIYWSPTGNPRRKVYLDQNEGIPIQDIWLDFPDAYNQNVAITGYPTEKNAALLERIIQASSVEHSLVLDCFAGSGTTLHAASLLNRRWIGIDESETAITAIIHRFAHGLHKMGDFVTRPLPVEMEPQTLSPTLWNVLTTDQVIPTQSISIIPPRRNFNLYATNTLTPEQVQRLNRLQQ